MPPQRLHIQGTDSLLCQRLEAGHQQGVYFLNMITHFPRRKFLACSNTLHVTLTLVPSSTIVPVWTDLICSQAVNVLAEMLLNSTFDPAAIEREKGTILQVMFILQTHFGEYSESTKPHCCRRWRSLRKLRRRSFSTTVSPPPTSHIFAIMS